MMKRKLFITFAVTAMQLFACRVMAQSKYIQAVDEYVPAPGTHRNAAKFRADIRLKNTCPALFGNL